MWNASYVYGEDTTSGWGYRYFFTYYNDVDGDKSIVDVIVEVVMFVLIFLVSVVTNATIAVCVFRYPDAKAATNSFVLNLVAADILFAATMPVVAYVRTTTSWPLGETTCKTLPYVQVLAGVVLLWTLTLISVDRHRCIVAPPRRAKLSRRRAALYCALCWLLGGAALAPLPLYFRQQRAATGAVVCTLAFPRDDTLDYAACFVAPLLATCLLPMLLLVYNYQRIFQKILSTRATWAASCVAVSAPPPAKRRQSEVSLTDIFVPWPARKSSTSTARHDSLTLHEEQRLNKHIKCVRVLFLNVVMVLAMWLPITVVVSLIFVDGRRARGDTGYFLTSRHFVGALVVALLNTVVNPLLCGVLSDGVRARLCGGGGGAREDNNNRRAPKATPSGCRNVATVARAGRLLGGGANSASDFN